MLLIVVLIHSMSGHKNEPDCIKRLWRKSKSCSDSNRICFSVLDAGDFSDYDQNSIFQDPSFADKLVRSKKTVRLVSPVTKENGPRWKILLTLQSLVHQMKIVPVAKHATIMPKREDKLTPGTIVFVSIIVSMNVLW